MDGGAHYFKADLQVHTPRDPGWKASITGDEDRRQFAREFVAACRAADLKAVAITDHHDFGFVPYIREAAEQEVGTDGNVVDPERRLVVFPGLELTLSVPCQCLVIFSADFPTDQLSNVLVTLGIEPAEAADTKAKQPEQLDMTLEGLHARLDGVQWLRGQYIVLPNVTDGGHYTLMRSKFQAHYRKMPCVGGYLDKPIAKTGAGNRDIFAGKNPAYGNKRIAVVQTSDARSFDKLGTNASWIKWANPTAEALRHACLAEESRIVHEAPGVPSVHITRLEVSNSKFLGPVMLELNPQYNAFIGGRGTGKSSALEYLRWALCDQPPGPAGDGDGSVDLAARRRRLIEGTLAPHHAHVEAHFSLNGIAHYVRRADRGPVVGLQELGVLGEVAGAGPAIHGVLLAPLLGAVVCLTRRLPAPACGAVKPWSARTREATRSAGLDRSAAWVPTMQPMAGTRPA